MAPVLLWQIHDRTRSCLRCSDSTLDRRASGMTTSSEGFDSEKCSQQVWTSPSNPDPIQPWIPRWLMIWQG